LEIGIAIVLHCHFEAQLYVEKLNRWRFFQYHLGAIWLLLAVFPGGYQVLNNFERGEHVTQVLKGDFLQ
jgi:hypothetical protein